jgi:hypothetical protein
MIEFYSLIFLGTQISEIGQIFHLHNSRNLRAPKRIYNKNLTFKIKGRILLTFYLYFRSN